MDLEGRGFFSVKLHFVRDNLFMFMALLMDAQHVVIRLDV